jgi:hypothetical protein
MCARHTAGDIHAEHDGKAPAKIDREIRTIGILAQHRLRDHANAEHDQNERAKQFGGRFTTCSSQHEVLRAVIVSVDDPDHFRRK